MTPRARSRDLLLDLDGTIVDSGAAIIAALTAAFVECGLPVPDAATLRAHVGPPLLTGFLDLDGLTEAEADRMVLAYRRHYAANGAAATPAYPGVVALLQDLAVDHRLAVATSKGEASALAVLERIGVRPALAVVSGASADGTRSTKEQVIGEALRRLEAQGAVRSPLMIGDRVHDIEGARHPHDRRHLGVRHRGGARGRRRDCRLPAAAGGGGPPPRREPLNLRGHARRCSRTATATVTACRDSSRRASGKVEPRRRASFDALQCAGEDDRCPG
ncbi:HAD hydrolase-like protein [uncultured Amnibacterium sp.]|uniref:HAD hydrolase-like protein n=1 Tax=uncultured Amnibacterium sp. TaxID=1631851 RepID=UPI0035C9AFDE